MSNPDTKKQAKCNLCGKEYEKRRLWSRWCSSNCRMAAHWKRKEEKIKKEALREANKVIKEKR